MCILRVRERWGGSGGLRMPDCFFFSNSIFFFFFFWAINNGLVTLNTMNSTAKLHYILNIMVVLLHWNVILLRLIIRWRPNNVRVTLPLQMPFAALKVPFFSAAPCPFFSLGETLKGLSYLQADSKDSDQTGRMPRLIWVCAGRPTTLLVFSCRSSNIIFQQEESRWKKYCLSSTTR